MSYLLPSSLLDVQSFLVEQSITQAGHALLAASPRRGGPVHELCNLSCDIFDCDFTSLTLGSFWAFSFGLIQIFERSEDHFAEPNKLKHKESQLGAHGDLAPDVDPLRILREVNLTICPKESLKDDHVGHEEAAEHEKADCHSVPVPPIQCRV